MTEDDDLRTRRQRERLTALVEPKTTAVLTMELQRGVVGPGAMLPDLVARVAEAGTVDAAARVCAVAREVGSRVVHCTAVTRPDGAGRAINTRIFALGEKLRREQRASPLEIGSEGARLMPQLGDDDRDIIVSRLHGMAPFTSTSLDQILRNLGIRTVVATGVSLNIGVLGLCLSAVDLGYQVVLVRDAVAGIPPEYAEAVIEHTLGFITTVTTAEELVAAWKAQHPAP